MSTRSISSDRLEAAFSAIAEESRIRILRALWKIDESNVSFSDLRKQTGISDSGQFNYHLDKLCPRFVRGHDDGYELTYAGKQVIGAAVAGTYTDTDVTVDAIEVGDCWDCGGTLGLRYERGYLTAECLDCDTVLIGELPAPPLIAANYENTELLAVFNHILLKHLYVVTLGFCIRCGGVTEKSLVDGTEQDWGSEGQVYVHTECPFCRHDFHSFVQVEVVNHPAVTEFLFDHGIDIRNTPLWKNNWLKKSHAELIDRDPLRTQIVISIEGDSLELLVNESLEVTAYTTE